MKKFEKNNEIKLLTYKKENKISTKLWEILTIQDFYKKFKKKYPNETLYEIEWTWDNINNFLKDFDLGLKWLVFKYEFIYQFIEKHKKILYSEKTILDSNWYKKYLKTFKNLEHLPDGMLNLIQLLIKDTPKREKLFKIHNLIKQIIPKEISNNNFLLKEDENTTYNKYDGFFDINSNLYSIVNKFVNTSLLIIWNDNIINIIFNKTNFEELFNKILSNNKYNFPNELIFDIIFWLIKINNIFHKLDDEINISWDPFSDILDYFKELVELQNTIKQNNENIQKQILLLSYNDNLYKIWKSIKHIDDIYTMNKIWFLNYLLNFDTNTQEQLIKFYYKNTSFIKSNIDILENLKPENLLKLDILINNNITKKDIIFVIKNNLFDIEEIFEEPNLISYINRFTQKYWNYNIKQLIKLNNEILNFLIEKNLSKENIKNIIENNLSLEKIIIIYKINNYKKHIYIEVDHIPNVYKEKEDILNLLNSINLENFSQIKEKIDKILNNLKNIINKSKIWINNWINVNYTIESLLNKRTKWNKLKTSIILNIIDFMNNNFSSIEINNFSILLTNPNIILWNNFIIKYESILTTIFKNYTLFEKYINDTNSNIKLEEIEKYIKSDKFNDIKNNLINSYFTNDIKEFLIEIKETDKFESIIHIAKLVWWFKDILEDYLLDLITLQKIKLDEIISFLELIKQNIINDINKHPQEIINICIQLINNQEISKIKQLINNNNFWDKFDDSFKYAWLNNYVYDQSNWIEIFEDLVELDNIKCIEEEKKVKVTIKWLWWFSGKEIISKLKRNWFYFKKVNWKIQWKWDHVLLTNWEKTTLIPMHKQVKASNLSDRLKDLEISTDEFLKM